MLTQRQFSSSYFQRVAVVGTCGLCLLAAAMPAIGRAASPRNALVPSDLRVRSVLQGEAKGKVTDRESALAEVRGTNPDLAESYWHSGWIQWQQIWMPCDMIADNTTYRDAIGVYRQERAKLQGNPNGDQELADWCRRHDLLDRETRPLVASS